MGTLMLRARPSHLARPSGGGPIPEEPPTSRRHQQRNITYDANDLEIPAFLRKPGDS